MVTLRAIALFWILVLSSRPQNSNEAQPHLNPAPTDLKYLFKTLNLTHSLLNTSNPALAPDCWICSSSTCAGNKDKQLLIFMK